MRLMNSALTVGLGTLLIISGCSNSNEAQISYQSEPTTQSILSSESEVETHQSVDQPIQNGEAIAPADSEAMQEVSEQSTSHQTAKADVNEEPSSTAPTDQNSVSVGNGAVDQPLVEQVLAKVHQSTNNMYRSPGYYFSVNTVDENTLQVEVRRDAPNGQSMANLVGLFQYDLSTKSLKEKDLLTGQWNNL